MLHALSTYLFVNNRLTTVWLDRIWRAGCSQVEIYCARQHLDYRNRAQIQELSHWFKDSPMQPIALHAPIYSDDCWGKTGPNANVTITEPVKSKRILMVDEIKRALEIAECIPFRYLVQHIGVPGEEYDERKVEAAFTALDELRVFAKQRGVEILVENTGNRLSTAERLIQFLELTHLDLHFCFDTGHAHRDEGVESAYQIMRNRIRLTHVHDSDGVHEDHLFPYLNPKGSIDWNRTMELLRSRSEQYPLMLELREDPGIASPIEAVQQVFDKLEAEPGEAR